MPIFELGRAIPIQSHVCKFGSDWLSLSSIIGVTNKNKNKKKQLKPFGFEPPGGGLQ